jgi:ABC-type glycerol-3-phosphate transport system permease component
MIIALSSAYLVHAKVVSLKWRINIASGAIGLFFLPAFAVYPGLTVLSDIFPFYRDVTVQLLVIQTLQSFPIAFILLVTLFASLPRAHFDQLLLETGSRVRAFWIGVVRMRMSGVLAIATITCATVWNEFYITNLITTYYQSKPFSVKLQMFSGQYRLNFSSLAAGAVASLFFTVGPLAGWLIVSYILRKKGSYGRNSDRDT